MIKQESRSWQRFDGKLRSLKQYLQLMDLALNISNTQCNKTKDTPISIGVALGDKLNNHLQLNSPNSTKEIRRIFVSARRQLNEQAFVELHCILSDYIANVISEIAHTKPNRLLEILGNNDSKTIKFSDIIKLGKYDLVIEEMAKRIFRILENLRSSIEMMKKLIKITGISINQELLDEALIYMEVRHLIIHNESSADDNFIKKDKNMYIPLKKNKLALKYTITNKAIDTIYQLCKKIDEELISKNVIPIRAQLVSK